MIERTAAQQPARAERRRRIGVTGATAGSWVSGSGTDGSSSTAVATADGVHRPEQGRAARVANRARDTMGFSIVGPGRFIGSGHPDFREDDVRPRLLGLIESDDRGETWDRISLHGKVDFHALTADHGKVYGYDPTSQTLVVSQNRKDCDRRSTLPMADFAVDAAEPDPLLATTERALVRSMDGHRRWQLVVGDPTLVVRTWSSRGQLYGGTPDGTGQRSEDGGVTWGERGTVGAEPEAITIDVRDDNETLDVAATDRGIRTRDDQGRTSTTRHSE